MLHYTVIHALYVTQPCLGAVTAVRAIQGKSDRDGTDDMETERGRWERSEGRGRAGEGQGKGGRLFTDSMIVPELYTKQSPGRSTGVCPGDDAAPPT